MPTGAISTVANLRIMAFLPDGRAFFTAPPEGLLEPLQDRLLAKVRGTYAIRGDEVTVRWNNGYLQRFRLRSGALDLEYAETVGSGNGRREAGTFQRLDHLDGLRLEGTYQKGSGTYVEPARIRFAEDGRFVENKVVEETVNLLPVSEWDVRRRTAPSGGNGTYRIERNTLELHYAGGPVVRFMFALPPPMAAVLQPDFILINQFQFARVQ
jgi:hypothetical protein